MSKKVLAGAVVAALAVVAAVLWLGRGASEGDAVTDGEAARQGRRIGEAAVGAKKSAKSGAKPARQKRIAEARQAGSDVAGSADEADGAGEAELSPEDQKRVDAIQSALDDENLAEVRKLAEKSADHPVAEVRQRAIEALQWFGEKALDSMTPFLADADDDVRTTAMDAVEQALAGLESESAKLAYVEALFKINGACSEDGLTMLAGQLNGLSDSAAVVGAAVRVIEANTNPAAVKEMKEVYEFVTGDSYTTPDAAQLWQAEWRADNDGVADGSEGDGE